MQINIQKDLYGEQLLTLIETGRLNNTSAYVDSQKNIIIKGHIIIDEVVFTRQFQMPFYKSRIIENCTFRKDVVVDLNENAVLLLFKNCIFEGNVEIKSVKPRIFQENCVFRGNLSVLAWSNSEYLIEKLTINKTLSLTGVYSSLIIKEINKEDQDELGRLHLFGDIIDTTYPYNKIIIENCNFLDISISGAIRDEGIVRNVIAHKLDFNHAYIGLNFIIESSKINHLHLDNVKGNEKESHRFFELKNQCQFTKAFIALSMIDKMDITECKFDHLQLSGTLKTKSIFNIQETEFLKLEFSKVFNEGLFTIRDLKKLNNTILVIESSNMGKTDFVKCDFSKSEIEFNNSKITDIFPILTDFPSLVTNNSDQARLFFSQLHTVFNKQGDTIRSLEYQAREVEAYYKKISLYSGEYATKITLFLNKISTSFGRNWIQGVIFSISIAVIFFYALVISTNQYSIAFTLDWNGRFFPSFMKFMNPLRFLETENLFKTSEGTTFLTLTNYSYFWDFFGRVFLAYGFFQTIQAFRKYGRK